MLKEIMNIWENFCLSVFNNNQNEINHDSFKALEYKFGQIDKKINQKIQQVNQIYVDDIEKLMKYFGDDYRIEFNQKFIYTERELLDTKINHSIENELHAINNIYFKSLSITNKKEKLLKIRPNKLYNLVNDASNKIDLSILSKCLIKYSFTKPLNLEQLIKYSYLLKTRKSIEIKPPNRFSSINCINRLAVNKIFFYVSVENSSDDKMVIIDNKGNILKVKNHKSNPDNNELLDYSIHIIASFSYIVWASENKDKNGLYFYIKLFNFNLDFLYSFRLDYDYRGIFVINKNEIAFQNKSKKTNIISFNIMDLKFNQIRLQSSKEQDEFHIGSNDDLIHLNKSKFFFLSKEENLLYSIDRETGIKHENKINITKLLPLYYELEELVYFDSDSSIYFYDVENRNIKVYNSGFELLYNVALKFKFKLYHFSNIDTIIYNLDANDSDLIEFDEY